MDPNWPRFHHQQPSPIGHSQPPLWQQPPPTPPLRQPLPPPLRPPPPPLRPPPPPPHLNIGGHYTGNQGFYNNQPYSIPNPHFTYQPYGPHFSYQPSPSLSSSRQQYLNHPPRYHLPFPPPPPPPRYHAPPPPPPLAPQHSPYFLPQPPPPPQAALPYPPYHSPFQFNQHQRSQPSQPLPSQPPLPPQIPLPTGTSRPSNQRPFLEQQSMPLLPASGNTSFALRMHGTVEAEQLERTNATSFRNWGPGSSSQPHIAERRTSLLRGNTLENPPMRPSSFPCWTKFPNELPDPSASTKTLPTGKNRLDEDCKPKQQVEPDLGKPLDPLVTNILSSFEESKREPVHSVNPELTPMTVYPFLPNFESFDDK